MTLYEESVPRSKHTLAAHSPVIQKTLSRAQVISTTDAHSVLILGKLENAQFLGATLTGQHWANSQIITSEITATEFISGVFKSVQFENCTLSEVTFSQCYLENVRFEAEAPPHNLKFVQCTILDEHGHLAKHQSQMQDCVYLSDAQLTVLPKSVLRPAAPPSIKKEAVSPAAETKPDPVSPSRFTSLDV